MGHPRMWQYKILTFSPGKICWNRMDLYSITVKQLFHLEVYFIKKISLLNSKLPLKREILVLYMSVIVSQDVFFSQPIKEAPINAL